MSTLPRPAAVGAALVVLAAGLIACAGSDAADGRQAAAPAGHPRPVLRWTPGACVTRDYALTACNGGESEVVALAADPPRPGDCPVDTDNVLRIGANRTACVRNFLEPHPGAPGGGGGLLRPGDCVTLNGREQACDRPGWYGKAIAIARDAASCPSGTLDTLDDDSRAICLGRGGQVLDRGDCVARPVTEVISRSSVVRVPCDSRQAWATVVSFERAPGDCPSSAQRYLRAEGAYRPVTCLDVLSK
ncbi:hypothetical protein E1286_31505 [Nonomuraea terrae]|uniref:Lipoprotein n=1 Tax=Nonomuraea terrae TaxID=2530383 RepID=A0A4R4YDH5_9ACTN|nr:hypothetical protein [Nonomuraea terrae]TDD42150.1 hypothetical protein E1286_31505 [Nonomuraea terrae]